MKTEIDKRNVNELFKKVDLNNQPTNEDLKKAVQEAIKDRARIFYFIWKTLHELHPEIDADEVMREASIKFGKFHGSMYKNIKTAKDALFQSSSKVGILAYKEKFPELNDNKAIKQFYECPHINAFKELGCSNEEIKKLCLDMLIQGDYASFASHKNVKLSFPKVLSKGDECCEMTFDKA